ncbi:hypothetical protein JTB14_012932 [Gonioctena quinquepunctata]|nr:hypothetical protein JTB14_012932 [Gonioctena quinquepunctata]
MPGGIAVVFPKKFGQPQNPQGFPKNGGVLVKKGAEKTTRPRGFPQDKPPHEDVWKSPQTKRIYGGPRTWGILGISQNYPGVLMGWLESKKVCWRHIQNPGVGFWFAVTLFPAH